MAKKKSGGCIAPFGLAVLGAAIGCLGGPAGAVVGLAVGLSIGAFLSRASSKSRICDICGSPVSHTSYAGEVNGKKFDVICAKCKNHLTNKKRRDAMKDLLN